ncbi:hypothetical protein DFW101_2726 [Solidesulfovibrio carbinoliphilus subsp. oakridgensis]|uniref:Secreted protein n=1 Tax=Solidesulfovibrio carbinoliphilus subsp. oakridgensis TaxID=694327 RepID=G7QAH7_9BACT|nr:hypothetical protein [Solidesulfovibrio carbinoliphilus]EHJ48730.1 hypothetical protein DFW101_2726 [Solidesulfovibrio carbinoliphilus subsp. oakridgensis]
MPSKRIAALALAATFACLAATPALAAPERVAIYMTVGGPLEVVRDGAASTVLLGGRVIHQATGAALTAQSYMSVGDPADGYDAVLIRHGVGDAACPITYDLVTVGPDKTSVVVPGINKCSRLVNINVEGDKLMLVTEKQNGRTEIIEYNDKQRRSGAKQ